MKNLPVFEDTSLELVNHLLLRELPCVTVQHEVQRNERQELQVSLEPTLKLFVGELEASPKETPDALVTQDLFGLLVHLSHCPG